MKVKFKVFRPIWEYRRNGPSSGNVSIGPDIQLNDWLAENPNIEIVSWQAVPIGTTNELYMVVQYEEN